MFSRKGDVVLDPMCGSGTTLMAAKISGRHYIGIDIEKESYNIAVKRLNNIPLPENTIQLKEESLPVEGHADDYDSEQRGEAEIIEVSDMSY